MVSVASSIKRAKAKPIKILPNFCGPVVEQIKTHKTAKKLQDTIKDAQRHWNGLRTLQCSLHNHLLKNNKLSIQLKRKINCSLEDLKKLVDERERLQRQWQVLNKKEDQLKDAEARPIKLFPDFDTIIAEKIKACKTLKKPLQRKIRSVKCRINNSLKRQYNLRKDLQNNDELRDHFEKKINCLREPLKKVTDELENLHCQWQVVDKQKQLCQMLGYNINIFFCAVKSSPAKDSPCIKYSPRIFTSNENTLASHARRYGYRCHNVDADGNCFYHAVADQLHQQFGKQYVINVMLKELVSQYRGDTATGSCLDEMAAELYQKFSEQNITHAMLRDFVYRHMKANPELYKDFFVAEDWEKVGTSGVWAGQPEIFAISRLFNLSIMILKNDGAVDITKRTQPQGTIYLGYEAKHMGAHDCAHYLSLRPDNVAVAETRFDDLLQKEGAFDTAYDYSSQANNHIQFSLKPQKPPQEPPSQAIIGAACAPS